MRIVVCGAAGMLGRDVVGLAEAAGHTVVALGLGDLDVTDAPATERVVAEARPDAVVNCAAYTDVDGAESEPEEALRVNAGGARSVAAAAARVGASVLYPSTDYVFDGTSRTPYVEAAEPRPLSSYGRSKLAGERETGAANPAHWVVRSSWLFGAGGRNFVETMLAAGRERDQVDVVADQVGCPTYTRHLAAALLRLLANGAYGVHHAAGAGACSWFEFAVEIFRMANVDCRVRPARTAELGRPAPRPAYSVLASERGDAPRLPHWRAGLEEYLAERRAVVR